MKNTKKASRLLTYCSLVASAAIICGCASDKAPANAKPEAPAAETSKAKTPYKNRQYAADPSKIKFSEFKAFELKETVLSPQENSEGNQKSAKKIDGMLAAGLKGIWPELKVIPPGEDFSKSDQRTLQIIPRIEHIRLVSVGARVWVGAMAGGSDLVMHVDYRDSSTGEIIANPDFWKGNSAWSGGWGSKDNQIRDAAVAQIIGYTVANK
jgi:hypothetical protein